uniref:Arm_2 domain-containing protein n=1 Tax=Panagrellus redivivus TaxID=6233 RepID=A0A7E4WA61_PANRE
MGQQQSSFVVEIASPRYGKFQSLPQKDPDEEASQQWRITVNPASEFAATEQLKALINRLYHSQKLLCPADARQILTALNYLDVTQDLLLPLLTVVSNSTAFAANQILLRESGVVARVVELFCDKDHDWPKSCRIMLLQCIANMAVDVTNEPILKRGIGAIVRRMDSSVDLECVVALQALTNLSLNISPTHITTFLPAIPHCMNKLWVKGEVNLHSLRLLVNLSCCPDIVPHILASKAVTGLLSILDTDKEDVLLRAVTWLLCMSCAVETLGIDYNQIAPLNQDPFGNTNFTLYHALYGMKGKPELENKIRELTECKNAEIANKSVRLLDILRQITPMRTSSASLSRLVS